MKRRDFIALGAGTLAASLLPKSAQADARPAEAPPSGAKAGAKEGRTVRVALVQFDAPPEQIDANLDRMAGLVRKAAAGGARWIAFHENTVCDYTPHLEALAEPVPDGRCTRFMAALAKETGTYIAFGLSERNGGLFHITHAFVGPSGFIHRYRKTWLWYLPDSRAGDWVGGYRDEWARYDPGSGPEAFDFDGVRATCFICADGNSGRCLERVTALRPQVVFWPNNRSALSSPKVYADRAKRFGAPLLVPNRVGKSWVRDTNGGAIVCGRDGTVLGEANRESREEILIRDIAIVS